MKFGDEELMVMFAAGLTEAFDMIYERYKNRIYRFAFSSLKSEADAEDIVQEVFSRLTRHITRYQPHGHFKAWIFRIAVNRIRSMQKRRYLENDKRAGKRENHQQTQTGSDINLSEKRIMMRDLIDKSMNSLSEIQRTIIILGEVEGLKTREIGQTLDMSPENVRVQLHRARKHLIRHFVD